MRRRKRWAAAMGVLGLVAFAAEVRGYSTFHDAWQLPVPFALGAPSEDLGSSASEEVVTRAMRDWTLVECADLAYDYQGRTDLEPGINDRTNVVGWVESGWDRGSGTIGTTSYSCCAGGAESDIRFNGVDYTWIQGPGSGRTVDAYSIVLHEAGHFYGLGHSSSREATMYASYTGGELRIAPDDEAGICALYPAANEPATCDETGCPTGQTCTDGECVPDDPGDVDDGPPAEICSPCERSADCGRSGDRCLLYPSGEQFCGRACTSNADCDDESVCVSIASTAPQCLRIVDGAETCEGHPNAGETSEPEPEPDPEPDPDPEPEPEPAEPDVAGAVGDPCAMDVDCISGICAENSLGTWCTAPCTSSDDCAGTDFECVASGDVSLCQPAGLLEQPDGGTIHGHCAATTAPSPGSRPGWPFLLLGLVSLLVGIRTRRGPRR